MVEKFNSLPVITASELGHLARSDTHSSGKQKFTPCDLPDNIKLDRFSDEYYLQYYGDGKDPICKIFADGCVVEDSTVFRFLKADQMNGKEKPSDFPSFMASSYICAHIIATSQKIRNIVMVLSVLSDGMIHSYKLELEYDLLANIYNRYLERNLFFVKFLSRRKGRSMELIDSMRFPFSEIRDGQKEFIEKTFSSIQEGNKLIACAPTGIGKTISTIYPALKSLSKGSFDKIFYLTAKTVTGKIAAETVELLSKQDPYLRSINIIADVKTCPYAEQRKRSPLESCLSDCNKMGNVNGVSYNVREESAVAELIESAPFISTEMIIAAAGKYNVCPYELSLDTSELCDVIICDYNYAFDTSIRFRRYFKIKDYKYVILVDEAHNLPDRARNMYSGKIKMSDYLSLLDSVKQILPGDNELISILTKTLSAMKEITSKCTEGSTDPDNGYYSSESPDDALKTSLNAFYDHATKKLYSHSPIYEDVIGKLFMSSRNFLRGLSSFGKAHRFFAEKYNNDTVFEIIYLDPSDILKKLTDEAVSTVMFSATLTPLDYFSDVLGCSDAKKIDLPSPYESDNLSVTVYDGISTRFLDRNDTIEDLCDVIDTVILSDPGNYIVYFPSYKYMEKATKVYRKMNPDIDLLVQNKNMTVKEKNDFIYEFSKSRNKENGTLVGFAVLGGMFAEGIDLSGEKLIGTIIIGMGLPTPSVKLNMISEYYEATRENGYDYAYTYPSMIKVLQAAGRVIRGPEDRGVVVLIDDRYKNPQMIKLFPPHWKNIKLTGDPISLATILERFWENGTNSADM